MNYKFTNYREFRNLAKNTITLSSGKTFVIEAIEADPHNSYAITYGITWGLLLTNTETEAAYFLWLGDNGKPTEAANSILQSRMVDAALLRLNGNHDEIHA